MSRRSKNNGRVVYDVPQDAPAERWVVPGDQLDLRHVRREPIFLKIIKIIVVLLVIFLIAWFFTHPAYG